MLFNAKINEIQCQVSANSLEIEALLLRVEELRAQNLAMENHLQQLGSAENAAESAIEQIKTALMMMSHMHLIPGPVEQTLTKSAPKQIALLRLDTDWYASTKQELEVLFPKLSPGGVLIIDDYGHWQGARRAVGEYLQQYQIMMELHTIDYTGRIGVKTS